MTFMRRAELVLATDPEVAAVYGLPAGRVHLFSNTLLESIPPLQTVAPPGGVIELGFVGRLTSEKNPLFALDVIDALARRERPARLTVLGDGPLRNEIYRRSAASDLNTTMLGWVDDRRKVVSHVRDFDFLLLPSVTEGSPKVMTEAMAMSTAVATWRINPTVVSLAQEGRAAVLCTSLDAEEWAEAIIEASLPEKYTALVGSGHAVVEGKTVDALVALIRSRLQQRATRSM